MSLINPFSCDQPIELLRNLVDALDSCDEVISGMTLRCYGAGKPWDGPSYATERDAARAYLQRINRTTP